MKIRFNICTPDKSHGNWGDTAFANSCCKYLNRLGYETDICFYNEWYKNLDFDLSITITGKFRYKPDKSKTNIIWNISHPELRTKEEFNSYDFVLIASKMFHNLVKKDISVKSSVFLQATDLEIFYPKVSNIKYDLLFVGNNYYDNLKARLIVQDIIDIGLSEKLRVIGCNWERALLPENIISEFVNYNELPEIYSNAKIVLNDHHGTMRQNGFINNRTFDLAALSVLQISDNVEGLKDIGIVTYDSKEELKEKIEYYLENESERIRSAKIAYLLNNTNNFEFRMKELDSILQQFNPS